MHSVYEVARRIGAVRVWCRFNVDQELRECCLSSGRFGVGPERVQFDCGQIWENVGPGGALQRFGEACSLTQFLFCCRCGAVTGSCEFGAYAIWIRNSNGFVCEIKTLRIKQ